MSRSRKLDARASVVPCERPVLNAKGERFACGGCDYCVNRWLREVVRRCEHERDSMALGMSSVMLTLTIAPESYAALVGDLARSAWSRFAEELEVGFERLTGRPCLFKWLAVPEFGSKESRLHVHAVGFHVPASLLVGRTVIGAKGAVWYETPFLELVRAAWPHGFVKVEEARSGGAVRYVVKYLGKARLDGLRLRSEWKVACDRARRLGLELPAFGSAWWVSWPRGRRGGLARQWSVGVADVVRGGAVGVDVPELRRGGRRLLLTRYERAVVRRELGLDSDAAKAARRAASPERAEMAARIAEAGSVKALRAKRGHVDADVASQARARVRSRRSLGRL